MNESQPLPETVQTVTHPSDTILADLLCEWEDRRSKGETHTPEAVCREHPELIDRFRAMLTKVHAIGSILDRTMPGIPNTGVADSLPQIPGYEVLSILGQGGMGVVYKARQTSVNRFVALKMIRSGNLTGPKERARFQVEAEAIAALKHPHIVQLYEFGTYQDLPYFTLEFVEGGSLAARIKDVALPERDAVVLVATLARAMAAAHANGIMHRDLKPENVLLSADGNPKITDFGLAKSFNREALPSAMLPSGTRAIEIGASLTETIPSDKPIEGSPNPGRLSGSDNLTRPGAIMGTPAFMAPEQARGEMFVGPPADIWALGAILYRLLTGRLPFLGANPVETIKQVINKEPVSLRSVKPGLSIDLEAICLMCLSKETEKRYATVQALADDLQRYLDDKPVVARPAGRVAKAVKWVKRNPLETVFVTLILGLLLGGSALVYAKYLDEKEQARIAKRNEDAAIEQTGIAKKNEDEAIRQTGIAKKNEDEAIRQTGIAKKNEDEAKKQERIAKDRANDLVEEVRRTRRQRDNAAILLAQGDFANNSVMVARERLDEITPENRGWEWHYLKRQFEGSLFTLYGHEDSVTCAAISADGGRIVTGSYDKTARVWDGRTGICLLQLMGHSEAIKDAAMSIDGDRIATMSAENFIRIWDGHTGECLIEFKAGPRVNQFVGPTRTLAMSHDGNRIITITEVKTAHVWEARTGQKLFELQGHTDTVKSVAVSADGGRIVTGSSDKTVRLWDGRTGAFLREFKGPDSHVQNVAMSADASRIVAGWYNKMATVWDANTGQVVCELMGHMDSVDGVAMSADGSRIVTAGYAITSTFKNPQVWDARTGQPLMELKGHTVSAFGVAVSADGNRVVTISRDEAPRVWNTSSSQGLLEFKSPKKEFRSVAVSKDASRIVTQNTNYSAQVWDGRSGRFITGLSDFANGMIYQVAVSANGDRIATGSFNKSPILWDGRTGRQMRTLEVPTDRNVVVAISADGSRIVTGHKLGISRIWDADTGQVVRELDGNVTDVTGAAVSADGSRIVTCSFQTTLVWNGRTGEFLRKLPEGSRCAAITPDGSLIVTGTDRIARIWDGRTGQSLLELRGHAESIWSVAISPDGSRVVTASWDKSARIWDGVTGQTLLELKGHTNYVQEAAFSTDGSTIVTASWDGTARVWDGRPDRLSFNLVGHTDLVFCLVLSADGERIVTGSRDTTARIWDRRTGKPLHQLKGHRDSIGCLALSADGNCIVTGSRDQTARIWDAQSGSQLFQLDGHAYGVNCVAISAEGRRIVTGSGDKMVRIWDGLSSKRLFELKGHVGPIREVAFSADGTTIVSRDNTNLAIVWNTASGERMNNAPVPPVKRLPRYLSDDKQLFLVSGRRVLCVSLEIDDNERMRRLWQTRPDMVWHIQRQKELSAEKNQCGMALHRALEIRARANNMNLDSGRIFDGVMGLAVAKGMLLKVPVTPEFGPPPREEH